MRNLVTFLLVLLSLSLISCGGTYRNKLSLTSTSPDGKTQLTEEKESQGFSILPVAPEKSKDVSSAYGGAVRANTFALRSRQEQPPTGSVGSGFIPEDGTVLFSTKGANSMSTKPFFINNAEGYSVKVLSGPFATDTPLMPGEGIDALADIKAGDITITYEWKNLKTGQVGQKTIPRTIVPGQVEVFVSNTLAKKDG